DAVRLFDSNPDRQLCTGIQCNYAIASSLKPMDQSVASGWVNACYDPTRTAGNLPILELILPFSDAIARERCHFRHPSVKTATPLDSAIPNICNEVRFHAGASAG